ncbi:MAG: hypothetical protein ABIF71_03650 [Planctomycetota bacterium]
MIPVEKVDRFPVECPDCGKEIDRRYSRFIVQRRYSLLYVAAILLTIGLLFLYFFFMESVLHTDSDIEGISLLLIPGGVMVAIAWRGRKIWEFTCCHCGTTRRYLNTRRSAFKYIPGKESVFLRRFFAQRAKENDRDRLD